MSDYNHDQTITAALDALARGEVEAATTLAQDACEHRADDAESWSVLGLCLARDAAQKQQAGAALQKATEMEPSEPRWWLHLGTALLDMGDAVAAERALAKGAELSNGHPQIMVVWGRALMAVGRPSDAAQVYGRVLHTMPRPDIWIAAGDALLAARDTINAVHAYEQAYPPATRPDIVTAGLADMHITLGHYDKARALNDTLRAKNPDAPEAGLRAVNLLRWDGALDAAKALQGKLWEKNQDHARLCAVMIEDQDARAMDSAKAILADTARPQEDRRRVAFALTHFYDKGGDTQTAWDYAVQANALYTDTPPDYGLDLLKEMLKKAVRAYHLLPDGEIAAPQMVYVIGPPRSGGSLLQTILARIDGAVSVGERGALMSWLPQMLDDPAKMAETVDALAKADVAGMTKASGGKAAAIFIDKTPHHVFIAGLLSKVHGGAKFVAPIRDTADMAVSLYFHEFGPEFPFTRSLPAIKAYLDVHADAVQAWRAAGVDITVHDHDAFTLAPEAKGEALLNAMGLPWSEDLLQQSQGDGTVRTFSARQVRGGVSRKFAGRGARYSAQLSAAGF